MIILRQVFKTLYLKSKHLPVRFCCSLRNREIVELPQALQHEDWRYMSIYDAIREYYTIELFFSCKPYYVAYRHYSAVYGIMIRSKLGSLDLHFKHESTGTSNTVIWKKACMSEAKSIVDGGPNVAMQKMFQILS